MPAPSLPSGGYSTNINTAKARRRKMMRSEAENVEADAKQADYKAMLNARNKVQKDPDFANASESQKKTMLETAMRKAMEMRRAKGQDTMSKMAAYRVGNYRGAVGPQTRVPIANYLRDNGWVPSDPTGAHQRGAAARGRSSEGAAPVADMEGVDSPFAGPFGMPSTPAGQVFLPNGHPASASFRRDRRIVNPIDAQPLYSPTPLRIKPNPDAPSTMSPEPVLSTIEGDVPMADAGESLTRLQNEMSYLRTTCDTHVRDAELRRVEEEMDREKSRRHDLEVKVNQMEGVLYAMENTSLTTIVKRVGDLEDAVAKLQAKVGSGCDAEVANMREVMGGLKSLLDNVGGFA